MYLSLVTHYVIGDYKIINLQFYLITQNWCSPILNNRSHDNLDLTSYVDMRSEKCWVRIYVKIHRQELTSYVDMQSEKCWVRIYVKIHRQDLTSYVDMQSEKCWVRIYV